MPRVEAEKTISHCALHTVHTYIYTISANTHLNTTRIWAVHTIMVPNFCEPQLFLQFAHARLVDSTCEFSKEGCKEANVCKFQNFITIDSMRMYSGLPVCQLGACVQLCMFLTHV